MDCTVDPIGASFTVNRAEGNGVKRHQPVGDSTALNLCGLLLLQTYGLQNIIRLGTVPDFCWPLKCYS